MDKNTRCLGVHTKHTSCRNSTHHCHPYIIKLDQVSKIKVCRVLFPMALIIFPPSAVRRRLTVSATMWPAAGGPLLAAPVQILLTRPVTSSAITGESGAASSEGASHGNNDVINCDAASLMDHAETSRRNQNFQFKSVESSIFANLWGAVIVMWWDGRFGLLLTHEGVQAWQDLPSEEWSLISLEAKTNSFRLHSD